MRHSLLLMCMLIAVSCLGQTSQERLAATGLEGTWQGTLGGGAVNLRLVLTITKTAEGVYSGILDSVDQGATIVVDKITLNGDQVRLEVQRVGGAYEGVLRKDESELAGTWTQRGIAQPLSFTRGKPATTSEAKPTARPSAGSRPLDAPIDVNVPRAPTAFGADGKTHLVYELHITNFVHREFSLSRVEVLNDRSGSLARYEGADLVGRVGRPGVPEAVGLDKLRIGPGLRAVVYMWVTLNSPEAVPSAVEHRVTVKAAEDPEEFTVQCARVPVSRDIAVIAPPLRGDEWRATNGPSNNSGHRRALMPMRGQARIAQRFAIDWTRLVDGEKTFAGDPLDNKNYRAYGAEALAVADGTVTEIKDGIPQNVPGRQSRAVPITLDTIAGNHVITDIGYGRYAFYAHLQPGSLRVKVGEHVKRGQVVGLVGNSGNSTEPHLHFHLSDASSPLGSEGVPYVFESFEVQPKPNAPTIRHQMEMPTENEVVKFSPE